MAVASSTRPISRRQPISQRVHGRNIPSRAREPVHSRFVLVSEDEPVLREVLLDGLHGPDHSFVVCGKEPDERHHQQAGIEFDGSVGLGERSDFGIPSLLAHLGMDRISDGSPLVGRSLQTVDFDTRERHGRKRPRP